MKKKPKKSELARDKHRIALEGTGFERCITCPGTTGKVVDGKMGCGRCGAVVQLITTEHAKGCNGISPIPLPLKRKRIRVSNGPPQQQLAA